MFRSLGSPFVGVNLEYIKTPIVTSQRPSISTTSFTRPSLTSLSSKPSSSGAGGNVSGSGANISTGAVVGGIAAGILGLGGIIFAILYFIVSSFCTPLHRPFSTLVQRRMKRRRDDDNFDSDVFRRQSRMLQDEPQVLPDNDGPFVPRPPTMIQRHMNASPVSNTGVGAYGRGPAHGGYNNYNAGYNNPGFSPGQVILHHPYADPHSASPMSPPMSPSMSATNGDVGVELSQSAYLSRQQSTNGPAPINNGAHYVDLSRASVTPFQAAQYEEIHRRLNMPAPEPVLGSLAEEEYPRKDPAPKGPSPFADPPEDVLPPPSPAHSNRSKIDSTPPKLPELNPPMSPVYALHPVSTEVSDKQIEGVTTDLPAAPAPVHVARAHPTAPNQNRPDTVYTIYDDEDAYAGI